MNNEPFSLYFFFIIAAIIMILFGILIGVNAKVTSGLLTEVIYNDWGKGVLSSLIGAILGAILGAYGTYKTSISIQSHNLKIIKNAYYGEVEHILGYLTSYLKGVVIEHNKLKINLNNGDSLYGPRDINFNVLHSLELELIKQQEVLSPDQRMLVHNLESTVKSIFADDSKRLKEHDNLVYSIQTGASLDIMLSLVNVIHTLNAFLEFKDSYRFNQENNNDEKKVNDVFKLSSIEPQNEKNLVAQLVIALNE